MDGTYLQVCAARLHTLAEEARSAAAALATADDVAWQSLAAERFRGALAREASAGRHCGTLLDAAASALAAHARAVAVTPPGLGQVVTGVGRW
jgi:hypothetical protein